LYVSRSDPSIPADLFGQSQIDGMSIYGNGEFNPFLTVDPNAFRSSNNTLETLDMWWFDTVGLEFKFLTGFKKIYDLEFFYVNNLNPNLPALPALTRLVFTSSDLNEAFQSDSGILESEIGLSTLYALNCDLDENSLTKMLGWVLPSSNQTLKYLNINGNRLESIPSQLSSFQTLQSINVYSNQVELVIPKDSFYIPGGFTSTINLQSSRVIHVDSNAFNGRNELYNTTNQI